MWPMPGRMPGATCTWRTSIHPETRLRVRSARHCHRSPPLRGLQPGQNVCQFSRWHPFLLLAPSPLASLGSPFSRCSTLGQECDQGPTKQGAHLAVRVDGAGKGKSPGNRELLRNPLGIEAAEEQKVSMELLVASHFATMDDSLPLNGASTEES